MNVLFFLLALLLVAYAYFGWQNGTLYVPGRRTSSGSYVHGDRLPFIAYSYYSLALAIWLIPLKVCLESKAPTLIKFIDKTAWILFIFFLLGSLAFDNV